MVADPHDLNCGVTMIQAALGTTLNLKVDVPESPTRQMKHEEVVSNNFRGPRRKGQIKTNPDPDYLCCMGYVYIFFLGGGFKYFLFSPLFGEDSHFD